MEPAVRMLLDRAACHDVMMRYAWGVDSRRFDLVASCFTPDVDATAWGFSGRDPLVQFISGVAVFNETMHMMGNQFIEVAGDAASMDTYAMLAHRGVQPDGQPFILNRSGNRYVEKLTRQPDGSWVIHQRGGEPAWAPVGVTGVTTDEPAVQWLLDRAEIHDLMMQYALGIDLRDYDRIGACFAPEFYAAYGPLEYTDLGELLAFIKGVEGFESTTHFLGTQLIEVDGDEARSDTYAMITHRQIVDGAETEWWPGGGCYRDVMTRVDGRWRITRRTHELDPLPRGPLSTPESQDPKVRWLLDRAAIHDVIAQYAVGVDGRDYDLVRRCFAPGFTATDGAATFTHVDDLVEHVAKEVERWPSTCHFLGNQLITIDGDEAEAQTYAYVTHRETEHGMGSDWSLGARRYVDRLVRTPDGWRIRERRFTTNRIPEGQTQL